MNGKWAKLARVRVSLIRCPAANTKLCMYPPEMSSLSRLSLCLKLCIDSTHLIFTCSFSACFRVGNLCTTVATYFDVVHRGQELFVSLLWLCRTSIFFLYHGLNRTVSSIMRNSCCVSSVVYRNAFNCNLPWVSARNLGYKQSKQINAQNILGIVFFFPFLRPLFHCIPRYSTEVEELLERQQITNQYSAC